MMWIFLSYRVLHYFYEVIYTSMQMGDRWINDELVLELMKS